MKSLLNHTRDILVFYKTRINLFFLSLLIVFTIVLSLLGGFHSQNTPMAGDPWPIPPTNGHPTFHLVSYLASTTGSNPPVNGDPWPGP